MQDDEVLTMLSILNRIACALERANGRGPRGRDQVLMGDYDCMFHDEGIPDAPCNCETGAAVAGAHQIVSGVVDS